MAEFYKKQHEKMMMEKQKQEELLGEQNDSLIIENTHSIANSAVKSLSLAKQSSE